MLNRHSKIKVEQVDRHVQGPWHPVHTISERNYAGSAISNIGLVDGGSVPPAPAISREEVIKILDGCAKSRASYHAITVLKDCLSVGGDDAIPDSLFASHAAQLRELCRQLPPVGSLDSVVHFHRYHTWIISATSELGLRKHQGLTRAIVADEQAVALQVFEMISSAYWKIAILGLRGEDANSFLNLLQQGVDGIGPFAHETTHLDQYRQRLSSLLLQLSIASDTIPTSFFLKRVEVDRLQRSFGGGRFSDIFCGTYDNTAVALKRLRVMSNAPDKLYQQLCREALPWRQLKHPHVLTFLGVEGDSFTPDLCMVSPLMSNGNALDYLKTHSPDEVGLVCLTVEIADGVAYLHDEGIVHGDIRARNVLIDDHGHAQISDFGLASFFDVDMSHVSAGTAGNPRWMAPELLSGDDEYPKRTYASDVYSIGRVYLELFTRDAPFASVRKDGAVILKVIAGSLPSRPSDEQCQNLHMSDNIWHLLNLCWNTHANKRPTARDVKHLAALALDSLQRFSSKVLEAQDILQHLHVDNDISQNVYSTLERVEEGDYTLPRIELIRELMPEPGFDIGSAYLSPDGRYIATMSYSIMAVKVYDLLKGTDKKIRLQPGLFHTALFVPNQPFMMLLHPGMWEIVALDTGRATTSSFSGDPSASICTNDGRHFVTFKGQWIQVYQIKIQSNHSIALSDNAIRQARLNTSLDSRRIYSIAISSDDRLVALNTYSHVYIWATLDDGHFVIEPPLAPQGRQMVFLPRSHELWLLTTGNLQRWDLDSWDWSHGMHPPTPISLPAGLTCQMTVGARWLLITDHMTGVLRFVDSRQGKEVLSVDLRDLEGTIQVGGIQVSTKWMTNKWMAGTTFAPSGGLVAVMYLSRLIRIWRYTDAAPEDVLPPAMCFAP